MVAVVSEKRWEPNDPAFAPRPGQPFKKKKFDNVLLSKTFCALFNQDPKVLFPLRHDATLIEDLIKEAKHCSDFLSMFSFC